MGSLQQPGQFHPVPFIAVHFSLPLPPFVVARAIHTHNLAQKIDRIFSFQFFDDFVFFPLPVTYSFLAPTPSTQYPFFNRAISTSCLATAPLPELMDRKKRDIMERKGDKEDENKRQKQQKESSAAAL